ncbi:MAG: mandelate racemase/muconate lactonizing enzyme family protein, partial [Pseudomonadota bacterium]
GGRVYDRFVGYLVGITVEGGVEGWGETMPYQSTYLPASAGAARAALIELAPHLIGADVRQTARVCAIMDVAMKGHGFAKVALEMAAWDAVGKLTGWPLWALFGGYLTPRPPISAHVGALSDGESALDAKITGYRALGLREFSCKASGDVVEDLAFLRFMTSRMTEGESAKFDCNGGWRVDEAIRIFRAGVGHHLWFEQPCRTYEECRDVRRAVAMPMILDECATDLALIARAHEDRVLDGVSLKPARSGGIRHTLTMRDFLLALGKPMHVQEVCGTDFVAAMIAHIAHSVPPDRFMAAWDPHNLIATHTGHGGPDRSTGRLIAGPGPGLGVTPDTGLLTAPIADFA